MSVSLSAGVVMDGMAKFGCERDEDVLDITQAAVDPTWQEPCAGLEPRPFRRACLYDVQTTEDSR